MKIGTDKIKVTGEGFNIINDSVSDMVKKVIIITNNFKNLAKMAEQLNDMVKIFKL